MNKPLSKSIFVFKAYKLCCVPCVEDLKKVLLKQTGIVEVHADFEKDTVTIKDNIHIVKLITVFQKINIDADLVYYKNERWEDQDERKETCDEEENDCFFDSSQDEVKDTDADYHMFKGHDQRKESRGKKEKEYFCDNDEAEDIGADYHMFRNHDQRKEQCRKEKECFHEAEDIDADHYKIRDTFKDHKPEKYVPPKEEYYWGDVQSGMHKKFPMMPGAGLQFTSGFPNYPGYHYPAPWPPGYYM